MLSIHIIKKYFNQRKPRKADSFFHLDDFDYKPKFKTYSKKTIAFIQFVVTTYSLIQNTYPPRSGPTKILA